MNMKKLSLVAVVLFSGAAFAQGTATEQPKASEAPAATAKKEETKVATTKKMKVKEAKAECLKENAALKGAELTKCIKEKRK